MQQNIFARWVVLSVVSFLGVGACSSDRRGLSSDEWEHVELEQVELSLSIPEDHEVDSIRLEVFAGADVDGTPPPLESSDIDVSSVHARATRVVYLAPGSYTAVLRASTKDPLPIPCRGQGTFTVNAGARATVNVVLTCVEPSAPAAGAAELRASLEFTHPTCGLTKVMVAPLAQYINGQELITLHSAATPGVTFQWTASPASRGSFAESTSANTTFDCNEYGNATLTITVRDPSANCQEAKSVVVSCRDADDDVVCGNGLVESGEGCEPPGVGACSATCTLISPPGCESCIATHCAAFTAECDAAVNVTEGVNRCRDLLDCYDETGCGLDVDPYVCLCGTFTGTDCAGGEADGVCLAQARSASLNATVFATLLRFTNPDYPVGDASLLYDCAKTNCRACL